LSEFNPLQNDPAIFGFKDKPLSSFPVEMMKEERKRPETWQLLAGAKFEGQVERTERNRAGRQENDTQHEQDDPKRSGHNAAEIKVSENSSHNDADNAVDCSHILLHDLSPF